MTPSEVRPGIRYDSLIANRKGRCSNGAAADREKNVKKSFYALIAVPVVGLATAIGFAIPADAATANLQFNLVQYDSPSTRDTSANSSVNGEVVRIYNNSTFVVNLGRYTLRDVQGHIFTFPTHSIGAKRTVYIHTGKGKNGFKTDGRTRDSARLYMQRGYHIWNNTGDTATLRSATGRVYDTCRWTSRGTGRTTCGPVGKTAVGTSPPAPRTTTRPVPAPPTKAPTEIPTRPDEDPGTPPGDPTPPGQPATEVNEPPPPLSGSDEPDPADDGGVVVPPPPLG
jgi:hypothetical protein